MCFNLRQQIWIVFLVEFRLPVSQPGWLCLSLVSRWSGTGTGAYRDPSCVSHCHCYPVKCLSFGIVGTGRSIYDRWDHVDLPQKAHSQSSDEAEEQSWAWEWPSSRSGHGLWLWAPGSGLWRFPNSWVLLLSMMYRFRYHGCHGTHNSSSKILHWIKITGIFLENV